MKESGQVKLQRSLDLQDKDITKYSSSLKQKVPRRLKVESQAQKATTEKQMKSCVRLYDIDSLIRRFHPTSSLKSSYNVGIKLPCVVSNGSFLNMAFKKKLHLCHPGRASAKIETHRTKQKIRLELCDPKSIERDVRQLLAYKISGNMVGIWLLIPEYLRLGAWDLLKTWSGMPDEQVETRLAMQLVNESALCVKGIRQKRTVSQKGFELANGLPFIATDPAIHNLLNSHCVADAQRLQKALGKIRHTFGHFHGRILAIDPHRVKSYSKRQMVRRSKDRDSKPAKIAQTFFCLDADTEQPICFTTGSSAKTVTQATPQLLTLTADILKLSGKQPLVMADNEHYTVELFDWIYAKSPFDMLVPMPYNKSVKRAIGMVAGEAFKRHWAGYATAKCPYKINKSSYGQYHQFIQRKGERLEDYDFKSFLCTSDRDEMTDLSLNYPERWHIEEFFKNDQALGWDRAGTMNLNIQYGKMTMALIAQAASFMMRQRIGEPVAKWDAEHMSRDFFKGLEGDIRVKHDTIIVTYYNAPNSDAMISHYENLPDKLTAEGIRPTVPWLYDFKLDFRFK